MDAIALLQTEVRWAHDLLNMVTADLTEEQAHWIPDGIANPIGALYVHAVVAEDAVVNGIFRGEAPLYTREEWANASGASKPQPGVDLEWARSLKVDLSALQAYARAVQESVEQYVATLDEQSLDRMLDLSTAGLGERSLAWALTATVISHLHNMSGEISALKGVQGARGYPF